jgi:integrase
MDIIDSYLTYVRVVRRYSDRTVSIYDGVLSDYLAYVSRQTPISSDEQFAQTFNVSELRSYVAHMLDDKNPKSSRTVNLHLSALSGFCRYLVQQGLLKSNPVKLVTKPKTEKRIPQFYRKDAMEKYFRQSQHYLEEEYHAFLEEWHTKSGKETYSGIIERVIVSTLYSLGLRRSELMALTWENIDLRKKVIHVRGAVVPGADHRFVRKTENKSEASARDIRIRIPRLFDLLQEQQQKTGLVISGSPNTMTHRINNICEANDLPPVGLHGLRHSFASLGYSLGLSELEIMEIGGWSDFQTVRRIYLHLAKEDRLKAESKIDRFFAE